MNRSRAAAVAGLAAWGAAVSSCLLITDAATRLANDLRDGSGNLRRSELQELRVVHHPRAHPEGCDGAYEVTLQESLHHPGSGGSLLVGCVGSVDFASFGYSYSTTYHLNYVRVPKELRISKPAGAPLAVVLRKTPGTVDVVALE